MKRTIALWLSIMLCLLLAACSQDSSDLLKVPVSANDCKGKNYQDVVNDISAAGEKGPDFCADAGSCFSGD